MFRLFLFFVLFVCFTSPAQSISPLTVNVSGATSKSLDYSIGESASIAYFQSSNQISLSTGFIQSFTPLVTGIVNRIFEEGEAFVLSPNPGIDRLRLKGAISKPGFVEFHLIDQQGRLIDTYPTTYFINYIEKEFSISHLHVGSYFIRLIYTSPEGFNQAISFKFSKIN